MFLDDRVNGTCGESGEGIRLRNSEEVSVRIDCRGSLLLPIPQFAPPLSEVYHDRLAVEQWTYQPTDLPRLTKG